MTAAPPPEMPPTPPGAPATPPTPAPPPSTPPQRPARNAFTAGLVSLFHQYGNWLVSITWTRFLLLAILLLILTAIVQRLPPFSYTIGGVASDTPPVVVRPPHPPTPPTPPVPPRSSREREPAVKIEKKNSRGQDVVISIDREGVRITPNLRNAPAASAPASAASESASAPASSASLPHANRDGSVEIRLPPGADSDEVREAVEEARAAVVEAIRESQEKSADEAREAAEAAHEAAAERAAEDMVHSIRRIRERRFGDFLTQLAWLVIIASAILKITYKGQKLAEVKAAVATETAESEQLKRQVVEARMAAMQAQVEPHFLFNTLASIDHLIETDPARASQMQRNLIALLRASMPSMRESNPTAQTLGREIAVIRPYLEILKVRMEDRLQASVDVPNGLLSAAFPSMMIQSLVENAIKHGLEPKAEGGTLRVSAEIVDGRLAVTVADTGLGFGLADTAGTGVGLANIRERLKLLYGDRASMVVADNEPSGTVVTLTVPYQAQVREGAKA
jgi:predicted  nucleic acid-binding Zn-ribbon protein